jgi:ABC-type transport system involved in multi-copper enzyme maturation permease subunit
MTWIAVAKKEYLENVRNAWVIAVSVVFLVLTLLASAFAAFTSNAANGGAFAGIGPTLNIMDTFSGFILPILALMLGFATIAGERESGSLALLLAQPLRRAEVVTGKWIGLFGVLATAVLVGFGIGGGVILWRTGATGADLRTLAIFILETLAWGAAWVSITMFLSAWFNRRGTAIAGSIGTWFLLSSLVWNLLMLVLMLAIFGNSLRNLQHIPSWLIVTQWLNPNAAYEGLASTTIDGFSGMVSFVTERLLPDMYKPIYFAIALGLWIILPFVGAYALFERKDA